MDKIQQLKSISILIFFGSIYFIIQSFYAINKLEEISKIKTEKIVCEVTDVVPCKLNGRKLYNLKTYENGNFYILPHKVDQFEQEGISKKFGLYQKSLLYFTLDKETKLKSIEKIIYKKKEYLNYNSIFFDVKKTPKDYYNVIYLAIIGTLISGILFIFTLKFGNIETIKIRNITKHIPPNIDDYKFPISKGDIRISKIKDYYVVDVKENVELHELIKIEGNIILKNHFFFNKSLRTDKAEYLLVKLYIHNHGNGQNLDHRFDYISDYYLKNTDSNKLILLFSNEEKNINEKGMSDYFIQSNKEITSIISAILKTSYKLVNEIK